MPLLPRGALRDNDGGGDGDVAKGSNAGSIALCDLFGKAQSIRVTYLEGPIDLCHLFGGVHPIRVTYFEGIDRLVSLVLKEPIRIV